MRAARFLLPLALLALVYTCAAAAAPGGNWASAQIRAVTHVGILGTSEKSFSPQSPLTQAQLADAVAATDAVRQPAEPAPPAVTLMTDVVPGSVVAGELPITLYVTGPAVDHVDFAVDRVTTASTSSLPYALDLDTSGLADGSHAVSATVTFADGGYATASWQVIVDNATGQATPPAAAPWTLRVAKQSLPASPVAPARALYRASSPSAPVTVKQLDAALVSYLGLVGAAREIQATLVAAGLKPPANTGTEAVARMLGLRLNHPAADDSLELLPGQPATRAEAAYSFARVLALGDADTLAVQQAADAFTLPTLTDWQQRILTTAVRYVGYPYVWGGTSPAAETLFGVSSGGGFDCSGYVWRVYKLTPYAGEGTLASVLRGRTTYQMSGEVPRAQRVPASKLQPGDVMFFGADGPKSKPAQVDHAALYLGGGWLIQSSGNGVTLTPFTGWYAQTFAWGRRPLREAGLAASTG
ncbi:MAG TPA: NlpC/P60 family protein [Gaiellaceae bacterium]|nr:NlpC/P60 family protein [Gaiellaceae bacterium]